MNWEGDELLILHCDGSGAVVSTFVGRLLGDGRAQGSAAFLFRVVRLLQGGLTVSSGRPGYMKVFERLGRGAAV